MKRNLFLLLILAACTQVQTAGAQFLKNQIIAHRGAWKQSGNPENSIASLNEAVKIGCGGSEFDVWMTADGIPVVHHDPKIKGTPIETTSYSELAKIPLSDGKPMPTLEEYLVAGKKQKRTRLILEIKASGISKERTLELTTKCVQLVKKHKARNWVDYISFDFDAGKKVLELDPGAKVSYVNWKADIAPREIKDAGFYGVDFHQKVFRENPAIINECRQLGLTLNVWTVNDQADMQWFLDQRFDFITTDQPELLKTLLK